MPNGGSGGVDGVQLELLYESSGDTVLFDQDSATISPRGECHAAIRSRSVRQSAESMNSSVPRAVAWKSRIIS